MKDIRACLSHLTDDWKTPSDLYNAFIEKGYIDCFPYHSNYDECCNLYFDSRLFINPPYSKINVILWWLLDQIRNGNKVALLIPARTDTRYFRELALEDHVFILFIKGRLHFNDSKTCAPFPSILMLFNYSKNSDGCFCVVDKNYLVDFVNDCL